MVWVFTSICSTGSALVHREQTLYIFVNKRIIQKNILSVSLTSKGSHSRDPKYSFIDREEKVTLSLLGHVLTVKIIIIKSFYKK